MTMTQPQTEVLHESSREGLAFWGTVVEHVSAAEDRVREVITELGLSDIRPMPGGSMSVICSGTAPDGVRVVLKAAPDPFESFREAATLRAFGHSGMIPEVHDVRHGVIVMEFVEGFTIRPNDARSTAAMISALHDRPSLYDGPDLPNWLGRKSHLYDPWAALVVTERPDAHDLLTEAEDLIDAGLPDTPVRLLHGDLQPRNMMLGSHGWVIDPYAMLAPLEWDVAMAATAVAVQGGNGNLVIRAGRELGADRAALAVWLRVAAVHQVGGHDTIEDAPDLMRALLARHRL